MAILSCHVSIKLPPKISDGQEFFLTPVILEINLVLCKAGATCVKHGVRWSIGRGPPRSMPGNGSDNQST
jgi:hypothetical protein